MMSQNLQNPVSLNLNNSVPRHIPKGDQIPFPVVSESLTAAFGVQPPLWLRPYGVQATDVEIDFRQPLRPHLETQLLACCTTNAQGESLDPDFFWHLGISQRTVGLLSLVVLAEGPMLTFTVSCPQSGCQQMMEVAIAFTTLNPLNQDVPPETATISIGQHQFQVRRPTGRDQLTWLTQAASDETTNLPTMIQTLLVDDLNLDLNRDLTPALPALSEALDDLDPLVNFSLAVTCPHCGQPAQPEIDLGQWALRKLQRAQQRLIETVHQLAYHYHWSESTIFAIPDWRRERYLALIEREEVR